MVHLKSEFCLKQYNLVTWRQAIDLLKIVVKHLSDNRIKWSVFAALPTSLWKGDG